MELTQKEKIQKIAGTRHYLDEKKLKTIFHSEYNCQAIDFLLDSETTCEIEHKGKSFPNWQNETEVNKYQVTLKNKKGSYTFDFYDSIKNTKDKKSLTFDFYSVLACLDQYTPDNFDEFCSEFGYTFENENDYTKAKSVHLARLDQVKNLKRIFTIEQLEKLSEIR